MAIGCTKTKRSLVETGQRVETGRKTYDRYFVEVGELRSAVSDASAADKDVRDPLQEALALKASASHGRQLAKLRKRYAKLHEYGIKTSLSLTPEPKMILAVGKLKMDEKDAALNLAVEQVAVAALESFKLRARLLDQANALARTHKSLAEGVDKLASGVDKKLIRDELQGALRVIDRAEIELDEGAQALSHLVLSLAAAVEGGAAADFATRCEKALARPKPKAKPRRRRRGRRPIRRRAPPKRPAGGDDFEM